MDYLATMHSMNIAGTGYGAPILCSCIFAQFSAPHKDNMRKPLNALPSDAFLLSLAITSHAAFAAQHVCSRLLLRIEMLFCRDLLGCAGSYFVLSMLDRLWHPNLTQEEAVQLMEKGIEEVSCPPCGVSSVHKDIKVLATVQRLTCLQYLSAMILFMWQDDIIGVARYVEACLERV